MSEHLSPVCSQARWYMLLRWLEMRWANYSLDLLRAANGDFLGSQYTRIPNDSLFNVSAFQTDTFELV
jgi:hypothetical protein